VHGVDRIDSLDAGEPIAAIAARLPRYGVTGFCPTTVACPAAALRHVLDQVGRARAAPPRRAARVLPAHLESNFISTEFAGAQPTSCLRLPRAALDEWAGKSGGVESRDGRTEGGDILAEIERAAPDVGIVTLAPELDGSLDLIAWLGERGHRVSLGHSAATYDEALAAIAAGARQATHLFNRMPPLAHRAPGLAGAILETEEVAAELICDAFHVHPAVLRMAVAAKGPSRILAVTDGTAASGLPEGATAALGGRAIVAGRGAAFLADGTTAGSVVTMDRVFRMLVERSGMSLVDAAIMCSTTPARELSLVGYGILAPGAIADFAVLSPSLTVVQTYVGGQLVFSCLPE
jgi:N-acetylglucosamine-6-phosphate deacetylase